ncbi:two-component system response regulator RstA [Leeia aquatica]|uniref:Two-component system response regulator RstA n=1 Tax=Leeia aquatica TaxID=2725557 RepID=A0A847S0M5_9NEIS|nr:two-component system response regulator RstA [Leeia aquatica]NLR75421.1 two-component system response regulator RstA [Leeia aquatica]
MNSTLVFVEDDAELGALIAQFLGQHGLEVQLCPRGDVAVETILRLQPALVLLDIMLPGKDGLTVCRELRPQYTGPIIMLTSLDSDMNQILALEIGANDFVLKTAPPTILLARIRSQLRQSASTVAPPLQALKPASSLSVGPLTLDLTQREAWLQQQALHLSTTDFDLLHLLVSSAGQVLSRDELLHAMRGLSYDGIDRSIDIAISRLRKKLGDDPHEPRLIKTVRNKGYLLMATGW